MNAFDFFSVPRIVFGRGTFSRLPDLVAPARTILVVSNGGDALAERLCGLLAEKGVQWRRYRQRGEPTVADVDAVAELARKERCDAFVGIGGGSAIDCAKAGAALLTNGGGALDYMEVVGQGRPITRRAAPWFAVPTTAGAGAEVTRNAVVCAVDQKFKASIRGPELLARAAVVDPELAVGVPPAVTASSGMDALCQCIEAYTSKNANSMTDALALRGMRSAADSLERVFNDGADVSAREQMALAALLGGVVLTNAGLGAVHGFAAPLGANFPIPHGTICAALLPHVIAANIAAAESTGNDAVLQRYADVGRALGGSSSQMDDADARRHVALFCSNLLQTLRIPQLGQFGLSATDIPLMVELAKKASSTRTNPLPLDDQTLYEVLHKTI